jgi:hypothetical protein
MTEHTNFYNRLDALQQHVASTATAVHAAAAESDAQLKQRIDQVQGDLDKSVEDTRRQLSQASGSVRATWAELKAEAAVRMRDVKANLDRRTLQLDAKGAAKEADWAEADAADALDFADWAVENAELAMLDAIHARTYADQLVKASVDA